MNKEPKKRLPLGREKGVKLEDEKARFPHSASSSGDGVCGIHAWSLLLWRGVIPVLLQPQPISLLRVLWLQASIPGILRLQALRILVGEANRMGFGMRAIPSPSASGNRAFLKVLLPGPFCHLPAGSCRIVQEINPGLPHYAAPARRACASA